MLNSTEWLIALRHAAGARSDYHLAQKLGVTKQTVSRWSNGHNGFGPQYAGRVADVVGVPAHVAVMAAYYWQAQTDTERHTCAVAYGLMGGLQADEKIKELAENATAH